jgi:ABC-type branched-subunit amino acid transport system permease subunit
VALTAWGLAGALAGLTGILIMSVHGSGGQIVLTPALLLYALAPALVAGLTSIPRTAVAGLLVGLVEQFVSAYAHQARYADLAMFLLILLALVVQTQGTGRARDVDGFAFSTETEAVAQTRSDSSARAALRRGVAVASVAAAVLLAFEVQSATAHILTTTIAFAIAALSVSMLTGLSGQVSLGQWAIAGAGAFAAAQASSVWHLNIYAVVAFGVAVGTAVSLAIGVPALRLRGLLLSVTTLAFAVAAASYFFQMDWAFNLPRRPEGIIRPDIPLLPHGWLSLPVDNDNAFYLFSLACLGLAILLTLVVRSGRIGRNLVAVRENERSAAAFGINVAGTKLVGFALSGALAGLAGAVFGLSQQTALSADSLDAAKSFLVVSIVVVGGIRTISGPILGSLLLVAVPLLLPGNENAALLGSGAGVLLILMFVPGGLSGLISRFGRFLTEVPQTDTSVRQATAASPTAPAPIVAEVAG